MTMELILTDPNGNYVNNYINMKPSKRQERPTHRVNGREEDREKREIIFGVVKNTTNIK
jgi:hypothetical protein